MRKVRCIECGKTYDYDEDGFCPRCGAFNQPSRDMGGAVVRTAERRDGLNEKGHGGSFLHREYHAEERQRRGTGLERDTDRASSSRRQTAAKPLTSSGGKQSRGKISVWKLIKWIIIFYIAFGMLTGLMTRLPMLLWHF